MVWIAPDAEAVCTPPLIASHGPRHGRVYHGLYLCGSLFAEARRAQLSQAGLGPLDPICIVNRAHDISQAHTFGVGWGCSKESESWVPVHPGLTLSSIFRLVYRVHHFLELVVGSLEM